MSKKPEKWKNSEAKRLLRDDIVSGVVPPAMKAKAVYETRPEYKKWAYKNFPKNLKSLREVIATSYARMQTDCEAYGHDRGILKTLPGAVSNQPNIPWHQSPAKLLLKEDVDKGKHIEMDPMDLHSTRAEYLTFPLKVFRNHIYQEVNRNAKRASRFAKKKTRLRGAVGASTSNI